MEHISFNTLIGILIGLIFLSAFFSSSETGLMAINPYRLRHLSKVKRSAFLAQKMLKRPDRLLGVILLGNNFVNIYAASLVTVLALKADIDISLVNIVFTMVILIFAEITPKTLAALYPEKIAFPAVYVLQVLLWIFYPIVWLINGFASILLKIFGVSSVMKRSHHLSPEELKTIVHETSGRIPVQHREMLLGVLELENVSINEIMVPNNEIIGLDLDSTDKELQNQLSSTQHTYLPVYKGSLDKIVGILHIRNALNLLADGSFSKETLEQTLAEPYFVPEGTSLTKQLLQFKEKQRRIGLVVNEYGDIQGLITLEDILEEVVGEFTTDMATTSKDIHPQEDGTFLVDGTVTIRELNRAMKWELPTDGPKTLSGLIIDYLETIPEIGTCCLINSIPLEVVQTGENRIKTVKISPPLNRPKEVDR